MKHADDVVALRMRGFAPLAVHVTDDAWPRWSRDALLEGGSVAVQIEAKDRPQTADLRFAVGLPVLLAMQEPNRLGRFARAFIKAGAARVAAADMSPNGRAWIFQGESNASDT